jgi:hypothetical protein
MGEEEAGDEYIYRFIGFICFPHLSQRWKIKKPAQ